MAPEPARKLLDAAHGTLPQTRETALGMATFTRARMERVIALSVGLGCIVFGAQAFVAALGPVEESAQWHIVLMIAVFVPLAAMIVACLTYRAVRFFATAFAIIYPITLALWPVATAGSQPDPSAGPWIWFLLNVGTIAAALAFPFPLQIVWTVFIPLQYGVVRMIQAGFADEFWLPVLLDVIYAIMIGGVLLTLGWVYRAIGVRVDATRMEAVASYAAAAAADAVEHERVAVAALMHDSVLAALIAAERAASPREHGLAVGMAREALTRLANAEQDVGEGPDEPVSVLSLADRLESAAAELGADLSVSRDVSDGDLVVPGRVGRALVLAATQAIANAIEHAEGSGLGVSLRGGLDAPRVRIEVRDRGIGFALGEVADDRLGIRASIFARVAAVGGHADIVSGAAGTTVVMEWSAAP